MVAAMLLGGLRRCEVLGLRLGDVRAGERQLFIADGKGGHQRLVPVSPRFFDHLGVYLDTERPASADTDHVFLVLKRPHRGRPLSAAGLDQVLASARERAGLGARILSRAAAHLFDPAAGGRDGVGGGPGPGRACLDRVHQDLPASGR